MDNRVIDILKTVIRQYGDGLLIDAKRCRSLLQDHCGGAYAREIKLLLVALEEGVATDLRTPPAGFPTTILGARLVDRLVTERYLDQAAAAWIVRAWADALGVSLPTSLTMAGDVTRTAKQPAINNTPVSTETEKLALLGIELIPIPTGDFLYGEKKERKHLSAYEIMKYPVTVAQYREFCIATGRSIPPPPDWKWQDGQDNHPAVSITWYDAAAFGAWLGMALPTEEEWEKAARGTDGREYPWGNDWDASKCRNSSKAACAMFYVTWGYEKGASPYGVHGMAGNVCEWCDSWYKVNSMRVARGGCSYSSSPDCFKASYREGYDPTLTKSTVGFRCVLRSPAP